MLRVITPFGKFLACFFLLNFVLNVVRLLLTLFMVYSQTTLSRSGPHKKLKYLNGLHSNLPTH